MKDLAERVAYLESVLETVVDKLAGLAVVENRFIDYVDEVKKIERKQEHAVEECKKQMRAEWRLIMREMEKSSWLGRLSNLEEMWRARRYLRQLRLKRRHLD
jgi:hypothetical protein